MSQTKISETHQNGSFEWTYHFRDAAPLKEKESMPPVAILPITVYRGLLAGHCDPRHGTVCIHQGEILPPPSFFEPAPGPKSQKSIVAAGQEAKVYGDPHVQEADGGRFDFQGEAGKVYNLINDSGFFLNAKFQAYKGNAKATTIGEIGGTFVGPSGASLLKINAHNSEAPVRINGQALKFGEARALADGGSISLSKDGRIVTFSTREGYQNTVTLQGKGENAYLDYSVRSGADGVGIDGRLPGGLVGHSFDADSLARNGKTGNGAQGEGAIDGVYTDYEVPGGLASFPQPQVVKPGAPFLAGIIEDPAYDLHFGIPTGSHAGLIPAEEIQRLWDKVLTESLNQSTLQNSRNGAKSRDAHLSRLELLLKLALDGGNIDLAMLLLGGLETARVNEIAGNLMKAIQEKQAQRKGFADKIAKEKDPAEAAKTNTEIGNVSTDIGLLQSLLQDVMAQKNEAQAMSSNFIKSRHDTAMGIIRNMV